MGVAIGLVVGFASGFFCAALFAAASRGDEQHRRLLGELRRHERD